MDSTSLEKQKIHSSFIKEQEKYDKNFLISLLDQDSNEKSREKALRRISQLKKYGIVRAIKTNDSNKDYSELAEDEFVICDPEDTGVECKYAFEFVGVVVVDGIVLKCYPKYISKDNPTDELKEVIKVIEKYSKKKNQDVSQYTASNVDGTFNYLGLLMYILNDYFEFGVYTETEEIVETNGQGNILWDRTINETFALISHNRPFYPDLMTRRNVDDDYNYFKRLHECVLTRISEELDDCDLLNILGVPKVELSDEELSDFGDRKAILYNIERELNLQYNTRKQLVLKAIYSYIYRNGTLRDSSEFSVYGSNCFNLVWQDVCANIFSNKLDFRLKDISPSVHVNKSYDENKSLKELISKPIWDDRPADKTLEPDIVYVDGDKFVIFDAKYYIPILEGWDAPKGQPGIESVTKQYLYQLAFKGFTDAHGFRVKNCFLFPTESDEDDVSKRFVSLDFLSDIPLENIQIRFLSAHKCFELYLMDKKRDISNLNLY